MPVIAANIEGLKDAIHNDKNGWLVNSGDQDEFIRKIQLVAKSPELLHKQGVIFRKYSNKMFDWNHIIYKYIEIINNI